MNLFTRSYLQDETLSQFLNVRQADTRDAAQNTHHHKFIDCDTGSDQRHQYEKFHHCSHN